MLTSPAGVSLKHDESPAVRNSGLTKSRGGSIYKIYVQNASAAIEYLMVYKNLAPSATPPFPVSLPADGTTPDDCYPVPIGGTLILDFPYGDSCPTSIVWCESTTQPTKTLAATPKFTVKIDYN